MSPRRVPLQNALVVSSCTLQNGSTVVLLHRPSNPTCYVLNAAWHSTSGQLELRDPGGPVIVIESCVTTVIGMCYKHNNKKWLKPTD